MIVVNRKVVNQNLSLVSLCVADAESVLTLTSKNRELLRQYLPWVDRVQSVQDAQSYILERAQSGLNGASWWKIYYREAFAGIFAIKQVDNDGVAEVGYWLGQAFHGLGIIGQIIDWLKTDYAQTQQFNYISWHILADNAASQKSAIAAGASFYQQLYPVTLATGKTQMLNEYRLAVSEFNC